MIILKTVFKQFCGGQTVGDSNEVIAHNWQHKVGSILDYSVEGQFNELGFEQTKKAIFETLTLVNSNPGVPLGVFKVTGLVETSLLKKVSSNSVLSIPESKAWEKGKTRIDDILNYAHSLNVPIMIDAEESWIQNAIDEIAERGMEFYNKKNAIVFNTIQCYKTDQLAHLKKSMARAKHNGYKSEKLDPFALSCEIPPKTASVVTNLEYSWKDNDWMANRGSFDCKKHAMSTYEVHLGSWMREGEEGRFLTYQELEKLMYCNLVNQHIILLNFQTHLVDNSNLPAKKHLHKQFYLPQDTG